MFSNITGDLTFEGNGINKIYLFKSYINNLKTILIFKIYLVYDFEK